VAATVEAFVLLATSLNFICWFLNFIFDVSLVLCAYGLYFFFLCFFFFFFLLVV
jgi:hypothetical protein